MKKVVIYTSPTCHYCQDAKAFMKSKGVAYEEYDVVSDIAKRQEMIEKSGQLGVPVIVVDEEVMVGYDEDNLARLLGA